MSSTKLNFKHGLSDGIPICLGYLSVSFAFGMIAVEKGFSKFIPALVSLTNFTGTGQFAGIDLMAQSISYFEITCAMLVINARYFLMSLSLSQRLSENVSLLERCLIAFGNTDEVYAVAMSKNQNLDFSYLMGLILCSFLGWVSGTVLGSFVGGIMPASVLSALGIAFYAMFIAIIIPPSKKSAAVRCVILASAALSCLFFYTPVLKNLSGGWVIIICGVLSSVLGAVLFPAKTEEAHEH